MSSLRHNVMTIFLFFVFQADAIRRLVILRITPTSSRHQKGSNIAAAALFLLLQGNMIARYHLLENMVK